MNCRVTVHSIPDLKKEVEVILELERVWPFKNSSSPKKDWGLQLCLDISELPFPMEGADQLIEKPGYLTTYNMCKGYL